MKIAIGRRGDDIVAVKDYADIQGRGEIAHFLAELESIKKDLLELWEKHNKEDTIVNEL